MKGNGYSLWLEPTGELRYQLLDIINHLAKEYGTPVFEPHITLLGEIVVPDRLIITETERLVKDASPFTLKLDSVGYKELFWQALFIRMYQSEPLFALHEKAKEIFNKHNIPGYMPHCSLLYGNLAADIKDTIIKSLPSFEGKEFPVNRVHVYSTFGEVHEWKKVTEVPFTLTAS